MRSATAARAGSASSQRRVSAFCAVSHSVTLAVESFSSQRYGSDTVTSWYVSATGISAVSG